MKDGAGFYLPAINGQWVDILDQKMQAEQQRPVLKHTNNEQMLVQHLSSLSYVYCIL